MGGHLRWIGAAVLVLAAGLAATAASGQDEHAAAQIYFYGHVSGVINSPYEKNPLVVQPASLLLFQDGSWVIDGLHWSGWGSPVARASGVSHAKSPTGSYKNSPAQLTLSQPKAMFGHTVYSCYQLTIPATPDANQHSCIAKTSSTYAYRSVGAAASVVHVEQFLSPDHKIWCELDDQMAWCGYGGANPGAGPEHSGSVHPNGQVSLCQPGQGPNAICMQNWNAAAPVLPPGNSDELHRYRCSSRTGKITCIVTTGPGKGRGFTITDAGVTKVG